MHMLDAHWSTCCLATTELKFASCVHVLTDRPGQMQLLALTIPLLPFDLSIKRTSFLGAMAEFDHCSHHA